MLAESGPAHGYGMTKVVTRAASAWADRAWSSLDVMTTGVTSPSVMAVRSRAWLSPGRCRHGALPGLAPVAQARASNSRLTRSS